LACGSLPRSTEFAGSGSFYGGFTDGTYGYFVPNFNVNPDFHGNVRARRPGRLLRLGGVVTRPHHRGRQPQGLQRRLHRRHVRLRRAEQQRKCRAALPGAWLRDCDCWRRLSGDCDYWAVPYWARATRPIRPARPAPLSPLAPPASPACSARSSAFASLCHTGR